MSDILSINATSAINQSDDRRIIDPHVTDTAMNDDYAVYTAIGVICFLGLKLLNTSFKELCNPI